VEMDRVNQCVHLSCQNRRRRREACEHKRLVRKALGAQGAAMPSLDQSAERIHHAAKANGTHNYIIVKIFISLGPSTNT
jgi:hypothetical protein